jgi:hypothetical protein
MLCQMPCTWETSNTIDRTAYRKNLKEKRNRKSCRNVDVGLIVLALTVVVMTPVKVEYWLTEDRERCCTLTLNVFAVSPSVAFKAAAKAASDSDLFDSVFPEFGSRS